MSNETKPKRRRSLKLSSTDTPVVSTASEIETSGTLRDRIDRDKLKEKEVKQAVDKVTSEYEEKLKAAESQSQNLQEQLNKVSTLYLPVTKKTVDAQIVDINPSHLKVSPLNKRVQALLNANDPNIISLKESLKVHQDNPILIRKVGDAFEVIYGTRRLFSANLINQERGQGEVQSAPFTLKALLADVPDIDVEELSDSENNLRTGISVYERALHMMTLKQKGQTNTQIAGKHNVSEKVVRDSLELANLDINFIKLLPSPQNASLTSGLQLATVIKKAESTRVTAFLEVNKESTFKNISTLLKSFVSFVTVQSQGTREDQKPKIYKTDGAVKAKITKHRKNKGQYKIDLYDISPQEKDRVDEFLAALGVSFSLKS